MPTMGIVHSTLRDARTTYLERSLWGIKKPSTMLKRVSKKAATYSPTGGQYHRR